MKHNFPTSWNEIDTDRFIELVEYNEELEEIDTTLYDTFLNKIAILTEIDVTDESFEDMDISELFGFISKLKWSLKYPDNNYTPIINQFKLKDINTITLGEFIDLDYFFILNPYKNIHMLASILYKKENEKYNYDIYDRGEYFKEIKITEIFGLINLYSDFKMMILDKYKPIFISDDELKEDEIDEELTVKEKIEIEKEIEKEEKKRAFSWEYTIYNLCNGDITKFDEVTNLPLIFVLNMMSMKKTFGI